MKSSIPLLQLGLIDGLNQLVPVLNPGSKAAMYTARAVDEDNSGHTPNAKLIKQGTVRAVSSVNIFDLVMLLNLRPVLLQDGLLYLTGPAIRIHKHQQNTFLF